MAQFIIAGIMINMIRCNFLQSLKKFCGVNFENLRWLCTHKLKNELCNPYFLLLNYDKHDKMQLFSKVKKILWSTFRATLKFGKFKVALYPLILQSRAVRKVLETVASLLKMSEFSQNERSRTQIATSITGNITSGSGFKPRVGSESVSFC